MASPQQSGAAGASNPETVAPQALEASGSRVPWATLISSFLVLLFYAGLVLVMYRWTGFLDTDEPARRDALNKLAELKAGEEAILKTSGLDPVTKASAQIPIDRAMDEVARLGGKKLPFAKPAPPPEAKKEPAKANPEPAPMPKAGEPKKDGAKS